MKYKLTDRQNQTSDFSVFGGEPLAEGHPKNEKALGNAADLRTPPKKYTRKSKEFVDYSTGESIIHGQLDDKTATNIARSTRYQLQDTARKVLYGFHGENVPVNAKGYEVHHRTCTCTRFKTSTNVDIVKSNTNKKAFYSGLMTCANSRTCPVCSSKISERKANEMRTAFNQRKALGLKVSMLTFTAPHTAQDPIDQLVKKISDALKRFWNGEPAKRFKQRFGIKGHVRSFEIRYGSNGWHPHFHIIIFSKFALPDHQNHPDYEWVANRWKTMCLRSGLNKPNEYGTDISNGSKAGEYITKFGSDDEFLMTKTGKKVTWDMADEMTKGNLKTGRKNSLTPWDILSLIKESDDKEQVKKFKLLFLQYARAMENVTLIKWSRKLRDFFGLGKDKSDQEIIKEEQDKADLLCQLTSYEWEYIIKNDYRVLVLELAENGGSQAIAKLLHNDNTLTFDEFYNDFLNRESIEIDSIIDTSNFETTKDKIDFVISNNDHLLKPNYQLFNNYVVINKQLHNFKIPIKK